jgi:predicted transglutaminase-like cysteine proteinase
MPFLFKVTDSIMARIGDPQRYIKPNTVSKMLHWMVDSKYRTIVSLEGWLKNPAKIETAEVVLLAQLVGNTMHRATYEYGDKKFDKLVVIALQEVERFLTYVGDMTVWQMAEKWQEPSETLRRKTGDCEDGAILLYTLLRTLGVPANRMLLWLGDVDNPNGEGTVGHCCLAYIPDNYPFNVAMLDWCYDFSAKHIDGERGRTLYSLQGKSVVAHNGQNIYRRMWFAFNEDVSYTDIKYMVDYDG